jgi:hypothetical protein
MKKIIRLTERDLTKLIQKIVLEEKRRSLYEGEMYRKGDMHNLSQEMFEDDFEEVDDFEGVDDFDEMNRESDFGKMTKEDAIQRIADFLKSEVLPELSSRELSMLKRKTQDVGSEMEPMNEEDEEDFNDLKSRRSSRREKGMIRGGLGLAGTSAVALLGEFMGYSESDLTSMLHDINQMAGLGKYTGPVGFGLVALGLAAALKGLDMRMRRTGK